MKNKILKELIASLNIGQIGKIILIVEYKWLKGSNEEL
jgi:hypothetical protein